MIFYRLSNNETKEGLWYKQTGEFTGNIHNKYCFCKNSELRMEFDEEIVGWLSATDSLEDLYNWFPKEDIIQLEQSGYNIYKYEAEDYKFYQRFQHWVINQETSKLISKIDLI